MLIQSLEIFRLSNHFLPLIDLINQRIRHMHDFLTCIKINYDKKAEKRESERENTTKVMNGSRYISVQYKVTKEIVCQGFEMKRGGGLFSQLIGTVFFTKD